MTFCRPIGPFNASRRMSAGLGRIAGTLALAGYLVAGQSAPALAQDIESPSVRPVIRTPEPAIRTPERDNSAFRSAAIATIAGSLFDSVTTIHGITQRGAREVNPILGQNPARIIVMKSLFIVPQLLAEKRLVDTGHPKAARLLGFAAGGFAAALAVHNIHTGR